MRRVTALLAGIAACAISLRAQQSPAPPPTFRAATDVVEIDVSVLDGHQDPVRGLTAADFTVLQDGKPQPIVAFTPVEVPAVVRPAGQAPWVSDVASDVVSNAVAPQRLIVLVIDDAKFGGSPAIATEITKRVVSELAPSDLTAVVFTYRGPNQNFTTDHAQLMEAVRSFTPHPSSAPCMPEHMPAGCAVETMARVATFLQGTPGHKILIYVGDDTNLKQPAEAGAQATTPPDELASLTATRDLLFELQRADVSVYAFDPAGLQTFASGADVAGVPTPLPGPTDWMPNVYLQAFAESTGGRAYVDTNAPWEGVPAMFRENRATYILGFRPTPLKADGEFRKIDVKVNRPGVEVRTRHEYTLPSRPSAGAPAGGPPDTLDAAIDQRLSAQSVPLAISVAPFARPGEADDDVVVTIGGRDPGTDPSAEPPKGTSVTRHIDVVATAFDKDWKSVGAEHETVTLTEGPGSPGGAPYELVSRMHLAPGRYDVRVAAESDGRVGSAFVDVDVPNFANEALAMSGVLLQRNPARPASPASGLAGLAPITPTTAREFATTDAVVAFARVYQGGKRSLAPAVLMARIVNDRGDKVFEQPVSLAATRFSSNRSADYQLTLPLARLPAGDYLLTIDATMGKSTASRDVRFTVK